MSIFTPKSHTFDAIVIGSGVSGGWSAKELCDAGLRTLVLERGRPVAHIQDYPTASKAPWELPYRGSVPLAKKENHRFASFMREETMHWAISDDEQPVVYEKPFRWVRGYHVGGKSLLWARQTQRWSDLDFEGPLRDGFAVDWPIRYADLAPWYSHVEKFAGIAGNRDGLAHLPDGEFMPAFELSCIEKHLQRVIADEFPGRNLIQARCAHLTDPQDIHAEQGRAKCQHQRMCDRGCIYGGYFSSNASTLPWAAKTGKLTLRPHSIVDSIIYDDKKEKATGVRVIDTQTHQSIEYFAKIIFVNASALNSNLILLNSTSQRFPNGLGNDSNLLGTSITWHNYRGQVQGRHEGFKEFKTAGNNPSHAYIPRFQNLQKQETNFLRGYAAGIGGGRGMGSSQEGIGHELRENLLKQSPGDWYVSSWMMGECVPVPENHVRLHDTLRDQYGIPQLILSCDWTDNDDRMVAHYREHIAEMFERAGCKDIRTVDTKSPPGSDIHEMGGVRMGRDPKTSLLNGFNQLHACPNVFVTDGACMTSSGTQNPSLTYMAFAARAANYAIEQIKKRNL